MRSHRISSRRTTAIYVPISHTTGLNEVHCTWAGTFVLEALCTVYPTINFALRNSDCVPTALFEAADLVTLMTEAMQSYTMASARDSPPAVLLMTESRAKCWPRCGHRACASDVVRRKYGARDRSRTCLQSPQSPPQCAGYQQVSVRVGKRALPQPTPAGHIGRSRRPFGCITWWTAPYSAAWMQRKNSPH